MTRIFLDDVPYGSEESIAAEYKKTRQERKKLPEGCSNRLLYSDVARIAWPSLMELALTSLASIVDMIMVGSMENGDAAIAAVSLANQPKFMFISLMIALNVGVTAAVARARGAGDHKLATTTLCQGLLFSLVTSLLASLLGFIYAEPLVRFMANGGLAENTIGMSITYLRIQMAGFATSAVTATITASLRGVGSAKVPMVYNMVANIANICLNWLLINGNLGFPAWGVMGASLATVIGQAIALVMALVSIGNGKNYFSISFSLFSSQALHPDLTIVRRIVKVGVPALFEQAVTRVGIIIFSRQVSSLGDLNYTVHNICLNIQVFSFLIGQGFAASSTALVGQSLGKRRADLAEHYSRRCLHLGIAVSALLGIVFIALRSQIVGLYSDTAEVLVTAAPVMIAIGLLQPIQNSQFILSGALRGAGDTKATALITAVGIMVMKPILASVMINQLYLGLFGAWIAVIVDEVLRAALIALRYYRGKWKTIIL